jgi:hypothetical protein
MRSFYPAEDYVGIPVFSDDKKYFHYAAPPFVKYCIDNPYTIVVFDDWTAATSAKVFGAQLQAMLDHNVAGHELPDPTRIFAVYNPAKQAPGGRQLPMANANRVGHRNAGSPSPQEWAAWVLGAGQKIGRVDKVYEQELDPKKEEKRVLAAWPEHIAWASGIMAGAVVAHPELLENIPETFDPDASKAFPTCRTADFARLALATSKVHDLDIVERNDLVQSFIGEGGAALINAYIVKADINPLEYLDGGRKFEYDNRLDRTVALVNACSAYVCNDDSDQRIRRAKILFGILDRIAGVAGDNVIPALGPLSDAGLLALPEARNMLKTMNPILREAGYYDQIAS